ncbi:hypothetical protein [Runella aurantiaca]|uniref:Uncharacterized protein n=1 Tax=Runella aurantiaca TaxID=2282308 RepID=A0A369I0U5_9BACT|nr:hypothetical protein [Runella aurantiaca]RDB02500.1 hypothetical protein DVG78_28685 [Runella aurantiaca]
MKLYLTFLLFIVKVSLFAQQTTDSLLLNKINILEKEALTKVEFSNKYEDLVKKLDTEEKINEKTLESISKQLDAATYNLTVFGILFSIAAIFLGVYITFTERKVVKIGEENRELLLKNQKIKQEVEDLNNLIQKDIFGLFIKIKNEETSHLIDRLVKVPKDIVNLLPILVTREISVDQFSKFKIAYGKLKLDDKQYKDLYNVALYQHFIYPLLKDGDLREEFSKYISIGIKDSFENDIIKSTSDFASAIVDFGINKYKVEINEYFKGLTSSSHKDFLEVYKTLFQYLHTRKNQFELFSLLDSTPEVIDAKINYGNLLVEEYTNKNPSESEQLVFNEIILMKNMQSENAEK